MIVYICDSRGVRDIIEVDGGDSVAASEPLVVLVCSFLFKYITMFWHTFWWHDSCFLRLVYTVLEHIENTTLLSPND